MKKYIVRAGWSLLILFCLGHTAYFGFIVFSEWENESQGRIYGDSYSMDSKTVISAFEQGEKNLFTLLPEEDIENLDESENIKENPPSKWAQQDFLKILEIFYQDVLLGSFQDRNIKRLNFYVGDCKDTLHGPQSARISTFNTYFPIFDWPNITSYSYNIDLQNNLVDWDGDYFEPILSWQLSSINLATVTLTAEQALYIAETHGGQNVRTANTNLCDIDIFMSANTHNKNWVVSYNSTIDSYITLLSLEIDKDTGDYTVLSEGGAGFHAFDSKNILNALVEGKTDVFEAQTTRPTDISNLPPVTWTQEDYYQIAKAFNKAILNEELDEWSIHYISFELDCDDALYGPQEMRFSLLRPSVLNRHYFIQNIDINPRTNTITWSNEYGYDVNRLSIVERKKEVVDKSWIKVPAEVALSTVYDAEGKNLHLALKKSDRKCQMNGWLDNLAGFEDENSLEWHIGEWKRDYEILEEEDTQLSAFVNAKTGELRFFKFYGNLNP